MSSFASKAAQMQSDLLRAVELAARSPGAPALPPLRKTQRPAAPSHETAAPHQHTSPTDAAKMPRSPRSCPASPSPGVSIMLASSRLSSHGSANNLVALGETPAGSPKLHGHSPVLCDSSPSQRLTIIPGVLPRIANLSSGCADGMALLSSAACLVGRTAPNAAAANPAVGAKRPLDAAC
jgi:hypothetical protein